MKKLILLIIAICISITLLLGCKSKETIKTDIKIGTPRNEVIELLGEPQGTLFGNYGDIYIIDNSKVIVYYEVRTNSDAVVKEVKVSDDLLNFSFDESGNYIGFSDLTSNYTTEGAKADGYFTTKDLEIIANKNVWDSFVETSLSNKNSSIRMIKFYSEGADSTYFLDLFYMDGYYYLFDSSAKNKEKYPYKYLLTLEGRFGNPQRDSSITLLTDDNTLTFDMVMRSVFSSNMDYIKSIPPYKLIMVK
nr:hypothetical protein [Sedimentibacter sp.]